MIKVIKIKNLRREKPWYEWDIRCDRANPILGNHVGKGLPRMEAIDAFEEYINASIADKSQPINSVRQEMNRLYQILVKHQKLNLFCWCTPKPCHTEVIAELLKKAYQQRHQPK